MNYFDKNDLDSDFKNDFDDVDDENMLTEGKPDYDFDYDYDYEYIYNKNKNLCSGYFCSFIPLINNNNSLNIPIFNKCYKKQISNKFSKYNKKYVTKINRRCSDIVENFYNINNNTKSQGSGSMKHTTQGCSNSVDKCFYSKTKTKGFGPKKYTTQGSSSSGLHISTTPGCNGSGPRLYSNQGGRGPKPREVTYQADKGSGPAMYTTPGCIGSGPSTNLKYRKDNFRPKAIPEIGDQVTIQAYTMNSQVEGVEVTGTGIGQLRPQVAQTTGTGQSQPIIDNSIVPHYRETPVHPASIVPKRLFRKRLRSVENGNNNTYEDIEEMNVGILLINTLVITAIKV